MPFHMRCPFWIRIHNHFAFQLLYLVHILCRGKFRSNLRCSSLSAAIMIVALLELNVFLNMSLNALKLPFYDLLLLPLIVYLVRVLFPWCRHLFVVGGLFPWSSNLFIYLSLCLSVPLSHKQSFLQDLITFVSGLYWSSTNCTSVQWSIITFFFLFSFFIIFLREWISSRAW